MLDDCHIINRLNILCNSVIFCGVVYCSLQIFLCLAVFAFARHANPHDGIRTDIIRSAAESLVVIVKRIECRIVELLYAETCQIQIFDIFVVLGVCRRNNRLWLFHLGENLLLIRHKLFVVFRIESDAEIFVFGRRRH